ncbi:extracellular matrix regulator RemB [Proteiniborus sp.]|uniref:extracellular matrix regulator RemB n=1 Tax=Proteiniborus sp. TaxID=2079015 RepID=UPI003327B27C
MFLHIGKDLVIPLKELIAIIDAESALKLEDTKNFLKVAGEEGFIYDISEGKIKSYIITEKVDKDKDNFSEVRKSVIYGSNISSTTLLKRAGLLII